MMRKFPSLAAFASGGGLCESFVLVEAVVVEVLVVVVEAVVVVVVELVVGTLRQAATLVGESLQANASEQFETFQAELIWACE